MLLLSYVVAIAFIKKTKNQILRHFSLLLFSSTIYTAKLFIKSKSSNTKRLNCKFFVAEVFRAKIEVWVPTFNCYLITKCSCSSTDDSYIASTKTQFLELNVVTAGIEDRIFACIGFAGRLLKFLFISPSAPIGRLIGICVIQVSVLREVQAEAPTGIVKPTSLFGAALGNKQGTLYQGYHSLLLRVSTRSQ